MNDNRYYDNYMLEMRIVENIGIYKLIEPEFLLEGFSDGKLEDLFEEEI